MPLVIQSVCTSYVKGLALARGGGRLCLHTTGVLVAEQAIFWVADAISVCYHAAPISCASLSLHAAPHPRMLPVSPYPCPQPMHAFYDLAADVIAENPQYVDKLMSPDLQDYLQVSPAVQRCSAPAATRQLLLVQTSQYLLVAFALRSGGHG